ncbi:MAG: TIGR03619 family F420-dependent LLM class oxidoreductase [SAR202 cluster bacterium]|nr:TIGR03619 family F420-dependent LLM class oxidoreductase [SAR202 cluster bacterium]
MKIGVTVPNNWGVEDPKQVLEFGPLAEEQGYDSVWVMDHLFNTGYIRERLEDKPYYHPMSTLSYLAAITSKVDLGTSVLVLPYHNPVELAKYAATLDQISGGRVILGVGVGAMTEEFEALGISMRQRGSLTDECMDIMKELWSNRLPKYQSKRWDFSDLYFSPKPVQETIPLWVGGSSPGAIKRASLRGDGWHPTGVSAEGYALGKAEITETAAAAGRDTSNMSWSTRVEVEVHGRPSSDRAAARTTIPGDDSGMMTATLKAYQDAGVDHMVLALNSGDVTALKRLMEKIAAEVLPEFR